MLRKDHNLWLTIKKVDYTEKNQGIYRKISVIYVTLVEL